MALLLLKMLLCKKEIANKKGLLFEKDPRYTSEAIEQNNTMNRICRVCGKSGEIEIFTSHQDRNLAEDIRQCSGVPIYINDGFPSCICEECCTLLQHAVQFREMCRSSAEKFLKIKLEQSGEIEDQSGEQHDEWNVVASSPEPDLKLVSNSSRSCHMCRQAFVDTSSYRIHLRECRKSTRSNGKKDKCSKLPPNGAKEHLCETCGKALSSIHSLISHRTIHENVFPFKCDLCQYKGKTSGLLRTHRKIHFADKPHACTICPKAFRTSSNLRKHLQVHKGQEEAVQCVLCDKTLRNKETLRGHVNSVHVHRPPVSCNLCGKLFKGMRALYKHRSKVHNWRAEYTGRLPAYMLCQPDEQLAAPSLPHPPPLIPPPATAEQ